MTQRAYSALKASDVIAGYRTYVELLGDLTCGKEVVSTGMTQEVDRAKAAIDKAKEGKRVCLISSGDPGVYGMAGLVLELLGKEEKGKVRIEIIPGVMALSACASRLGAPLMHDFAVISLSDLLTDLKLIERRVLAAAKADFVIAFYNPQSKKRTVPLKRAWQILSKHKPLNTPVGIVHNCEREREEIIITTLGKTLSRRNIDMVTMVIVGNSQTYVKDGRMITPRGYRL